MPQNRGGKTDFSGGHDAESVASRGGKNNFPPQNRGGIDRAAIRALAEERISGWREYRHKGGKWFYPRDRWWDFDCEQLTCPNRGAEWHKHSQNRSDVPPKTKEHYDNLIAARAAHRAELRDHRAELRDHRNANANGIARAAR